ncbi:MAG: malonyl-acyl carrier protein O-methyltransferase BioC [Verrucomicrobiaceae bacterium]|nr:malonyl-acyl carrier protein O-methyltransferase BioC [Verrucomicrobiaceae bacterium]
MHSRQCIRHDDHLIMKPNWYSERLPAATTSNSAPDLVLLHGWGMSGEVWRGWLPLLRRRCNVILLDLPGFGRSPAQANLSVDALLDQLKHFVPHNAVLLGWSLGGALALAFDARFRGHCAALITLACNPCFVAKADWPTAMPAETFAQFQMQLAENSALTLKRFLTLQVRGGDEERDLLRWLRTVEPCGASIETLVWDLNLLRQLDVRAALQQCEIPAVHILGNADTLMPIGAAAAMAELAPKHWLVVIDGAAHVPFISHADLCWQHLDRVISIAKLRPRSTPLQRNKKAVAQSFSRAAASYDSAAQLQRAVAQQLIAQALPHVGDTLLDIGCGTGIVSAQLAQYCDVIALDFAEGMLRHARAQTDSNSLQWLCGDAENLPLVGDSVDSVFSSLALQWCENPGSAFAEIARVLRDGGSASISTLGPDTLHELRTAWRSVDERTHVNEFAARDSLENAIRRAGLTVQSWREEVIVLHYSALRELTRELKALGAHNVNSARPDGLTSRARLQRFSEAYETQRDADGQLPATYQVWYLQLEKIDG